MLKKSCAILVSIALAMGILVHGSFAFTAGDDTTVDWLIDNAVLHFSAPLSIKQSCRDYLIAHGSELEGYSYIYAVVANWNNDNPANVYFLQSNCELAGLDSRSSGYSQNTDTVYMSFIGSGVLELLTFELEPSTEYTINNQTYYRFNLPFDNNTFVNGTHYANYSPYLGNTFYDLSNLEADDYVYNPDTRYMDVYMSMSTYGNVKYLCIEVDDIILSSAWVSVRYIDQYGAGTEIIDYPFSFFTANGHSYIQIMPDAISRDEFTVTSVLYSGSSSWGFKEVTGLNLTFNESLLPSPIPEQETQTE